ncbi:hypothetical protein JCM18899A_27140 [Nocardioides sp. AN3]
MNKWEPVLALGTVALGALWTSGGRAALQRRTIQHELDLAARLHDRELVEAMRTSAQDRAAIYLARTLPSEVSARTFILNTLPITAGVVILSGTGLAGSGSIARAVAQLVGFLVVGAGLGSMVDSAMRDCRAWLDSGRVKQARSWLREAADAVSRDART